MAELDLDDLVGSAREVDQPSAEHADQLFDQLMSGLGGAPGGQGTSGGEGMPDAPTGLEAAGAATAAAGGGVSGAKVVLAIGAFVGVGTGIALTTTNTASEERVESASQVEQAPAPTPPETDAAPEPPTEPVKADKIADEQPSAAPRRPIEKKQAPSPSDRLAEEVSLVRRAKLAHNQKRHGEALRLLDEYKVKFPQGTLRGEAQATRVLVLCALNQSQRAQNAAAKLDKNSPLGEKMKTGCKVE